MYGLRTGQGCSGFIPVLGNPAAARQNLLFLPRVYQFNSSPKHTSGERLMRSPAVLPFGWTSRYFFFAALVAICLFSLSTVFVSLLQSKLQLKNV
jgi:hypothetical protein